jgi:hypothetical protein
VGPTCGSGEGAQGRGGAGPRPTTGGRAGGERNRGGGKEKGEEEPDARALAGSGRKGGEIGAARVEKRMGRPWPMREEGEMGLGVSLGQGKEREEREPARERERGGFGPAAGLFPFLLLFFFFSTLKLFKQFYLNSNKFEFKPYTLNTIKIMLQHECANKLIL